MLRKMILNLLLITSVPVSLFARPFATDDAGVTSINAFELELGSNYWEDVASFGATLKHGLTNHMNLSVSFGYDAVPKETAMAQPLGVSVKYNFIPEHFSMSFTSAFSSSASYLLNAIYTQKIKFVTIHANAGLEATEAVKNVDAKYGLATVFNIGIVAAGIEICGVNKDVNWWQVGTQVAIKEWIALDIGVGGDFDGNMMATSGIWLGFPLSK
ncbi:MAG: hypothetical protein Q4F84_00150 [Fibrobacter sp.]|nr:hypothetical protein [Fibrobacter sp.]